VVAVSSASVADMLKAGSTDMVVVHLGGSGCTCFDTWLAAVRHAGLSGILDSYARRCMRKRPPAEPQQLVVAVLVVPAVST
jgi:hypothetical protein